MTDVVVEQVVVDPVTVRCGDQILVGGQVFTVRDMRALPRGGKRLDFHDGTSFTMRPTTVLWASRPRRLRRR
ncbi:hypothetical protein RM780_11880 [Streptomyces sp. DSM 44917]|uniref:Uncharacterized protein n=1 Tax=Streptomyces boetiae TaxID=3075541 RepID=A0ABU2L7W4_9ACTN|nr:hypothetical protein [Streptomyces sp. DSM 44917]MDT0307659.1 hypothetical protein [Streptomyces sp. DSM 44917]